MITPKMNEDGSCPECAKLGGWLCEFHKTEGVRMERAQAANIAKAVQAIYENNIQRICALNELESDEFYTREQKAERLIKQLDRRFAPYAIS